MGDGGDGGDGGSPLTSPPVGVTAVPVAAGAAVVPCWPRTTVQVVLPVPPTAVTSRISGPMATEKLGAGNPASLATVIEVWLASMDEASVVLADRRLDRLLDGAQRGGDVRLGHLGGGRPAPVRRPAG